MKPQKEGGGNNFYDDEAKALLQEFINPSTDPERKESLKQFMIMERINPPMIKAWMLRDGQILEVDSLSELGIYSCLIMDTVHEKRWSDELEKGEINNEAPTLITKNENFGTLMRTKGSHQNEGGVNTGFAVIDQPILYLAEENTISDKIEANVETLFE